MKGVFFSLIYTLFLIHPTYNQCIKGDCINGEGVYKARNGSVYQGTFSLGLFHGKGTITFSSNDKYQGAFHNGKKQGVGKYLFAAGHQYIGEFVNDKREGKGKMVYNNGDIYQGEWKNDMPNGTGKYIFNDGSFYTGGFLNGNFHGKGTISEIDGTSYEGLWVNNVLQKNEVNKPSEESTPIFSEKVKLKDCTNQYCDNENGRFNYKDGSYYEGEFMKGEAEGEGRTNYVNGDVYKGGWKNHGPHGFGTMFKAEGTIFSGLWENGTLVKRSYENEALAKIEKSKPEQKAKPSISKNETEVYAVIVGVATYNHMKSLRYTDDDAYHLYAFLKSPEGGAIPDEHISILIDDAATKKNIAKEISNTFARADDNDVVMLYMSGHGLEGSFVPADFDGLNNLLAYEDILNLLEATPAKHKIYITDACHSGSMYASKAPFNIAVADFYSKIKSTKGGTAIITSSKTDEVSLEYSGMRHGVFSHYLIQGLKGDANKNNDKFITIEELFNYIYLNVRHHTNNSQTPSISGDYDKEIPVAVIR